MFCVVFLLSYMALSVCVLLVVVTHIHACMSPSSEIDAVDIDRARDNYNECMFRRSIVRMFQRSKATIQNNNSSAATSMLNSVHTSKLYNCRCCLSTLAGFYGSMYSSISVLRRAYPYVGITSTGAGR